MFKDRPKVVLHRYLGPGLGWGLSPSADTLPVFPLFCSYLLSGWDGGEVGGGGFLLCYLPALRRSAAVLWFERLLLLCGVAGAVGSTLLLRSRAARPSAA